MYGDQALAQVTALVWLSEETLTVEAQAEPLAYYAVKMNRRGELTAVTESRLLPARYHARQPRLWPWMPNSDERQLALLVPAERLLRRRRPEDAVQSQFAEHRPAEVVPQPLVVEYELANRLWELVALPPALETPCALALSFQRGRTCGLDRIGRRTELVRGDVCDGRGLAGSVRGMPCCPTQVSGRGHGMAGRRASLGHRDLATRPGAGPRDRLTRSRVRRLRRREEVKDVLRARCRPQGEELVIRVGEDPTTADRHETRVAVFREDHAQHPFRSRLPNMYIGGSSSRRT